MPYANEHAARLQPPGKYRDYRRTDGGKLYDKIRVPKTVSILWAKVPEGVVPQALRFPVEHWTVSAAKKWLRDNGVKYLLFEPAKNAARDRYDFPAGESAFREGAERTKNAAGAPVQSFFKDVIRVGTFYHPEEGWYLAVDQERIDCWVAAFRRMRDNGVDVEVVVDHKSSAEKIFGYVRDLFRDNDVLYARVEMVGEGIELAKRVRNVSVSVVPNYKDGVGNSYGEAISHVSLAQQPIVPGQEEFQAIGYAASRVTETEEDDIMDLNALAKIIGKDTLDDETAVDTVREFVASLQRDKDDLGKRLTALEAKIDPDTVELAAATVEERVESLFTSGRIGRKAADALKVALVGTAEKRATWSLARQGDSSPARSVLDSLALKDERPAGGRTGVQDLSRAVPDGEALHDPETMKEMIDLAGGPKT